jgi:hypothetical protein
MNRLEQNTMKKLTRARVIDLKYTLLFILSFFFYNASAQLHHQMLSSQGSTAKTEGGIVATQTIGQQSVVGNNQVRHAIVGAGFQQTQWNLKIVSNKPEFQLTIYPNPFENSISILGASDDIQINIYNVIGQLVLNRFITFEQLNQSIDLSKLSSGSYLIKCVSQNQSYFTKLIKK